MYNIYMVKAYKLHGIAIVKDCEDAINIVKNAIFNKYCSICYLHDIQFELIGRTNEITKSLSDEEVYMDIVTWSRF